MIHTEIFVIEMIYLGFVLKQSSFPKSEWVGMREMDERRMVKKKSEYVLMLVTGSLFFPTLCMFESLCYKKN